MVIKSCDILVFSNEEQRRGLKMSDPQRFAESGQYEPSDSDLKEWKDWNNAVDYYDNILDRFDSEEL